MPEIKDSGKVWTKGSVLPVNAVRIDNKIFATGQTEDQSAELWLEDEGLCLDLHDFEKGERIFLVDSKEIYSGKEIAKLAKELQE